MVTCKIQVKGPLELYSTNYLFKLVSRLDVLCKLGVGDVEVLHLTGEVLIVGADIHETVAGKVEENELPSPVSLHFSASLTVVVMA